MEHLEQRYREHHRDARSPDFIWAQPERTKLFSEFVGGPGRRVLDLGCRYGALTEYYAEGNDVTGVDIDREALEHAEARLGIQALWADLDDPLAFMDETFDVVVIGELLEHIREPAAADRPGVSRAAPGRAARRLDAERLPAEEPAALPRAAGHPESRPDPPAPLLAGRTFASSSPTSRTPQLRFVAGRLAPFHRRLFANVIFFTATKPG